MDDNIDNEALAADEWYHELRQTDIGVERVKHWSLTEVYFNMPHTVQI